MASLYRTEAGAQLIARRYQEFLKSWPQPNRQFHVPTRYGETELGHGVFGERATILEFLSRR